MPGKYVIDELYRFRMLMCGVYLGICVSSTYGFSIFTELLKSKYNFSQVDITTISTVGNCMGYLSFFAGAVFDFAGPKVLMGIASLFGFIGFTMYGLAFRDIIVTNASHDSALIQFCIFTAIFYVGCPALDVASLMPLMLSFPLDRGYILIIQKTLSGLGSSVLMSYFNAFFRPRADYGGYAFFLAVELFCVAWLGVLLTSLPAYFPCNFVRMRLTPEKLAEREATLVAYRTQRPPRGRLYLGCFLVALLIVYMACTSIIPVFVKTQTNGYIAIAVVNIVIVAAFAIMALPIQFIGRYPKLGRKSKFLGLNYPAAEGEAEENLNAVGEAVERDNASEKTFHTVASEHARPANENTALEPVAEDSFDTCKTKKTATKERVKEGVVSESEDDTGSKVPGEGADVKKGSDREEAESFTQPEIMNSVGDPQYGGSFWRNLLTLDLWLMWFGCFGMWGSSTIFQANSAQIYRSKNYGKYDAAQLALYVALVGVGSAIGRYFTGGWDMFVSHRRRKGKLGLLVTILLPVAPFFDLLAYLLFAVIPVDAILLPFLIGAIGSGLGWGMGTLALRVMYAKDVGKHYNFMFTSGFVCVLTMNRFMFGELYDAQARKDGTAPACNQPKCIQTQMFILMGINIFSSLCSTAAHIRFHLFVKRERKLLSLRATEQEIFVDSFEERPANDDDGDNENSSRANVENAQEK